MGSLRDRVMLITGAGRGIGKETALLAAREGARLILCARNEAELAMVSRETGGRAVPCDVSDEQAVDFLFTVVAREFDRLDVVVNNAAVFRSMPLLRTSTEIFDEVVRTNLRGVFLVSRAAFRLMSRQKSGHLVNISSQAGKQGYEGSAAYCASKFGVVGLSKVLAIEGREFGIRVSILYPGAVDTHMWDGISEDREGYLTAGEVARAILLVARSDPRTHIGELDVVPR
jgi:3-oxoacyl-[acyl-carrier protein] reductase